MKNLLLVLLSLFSSNLHSQCHEIYGDRMDYALVINEDLDLGEEYTLGKPQKLTNPNALILMRGLIPKLRFSDNKFLNKIIISDLQNKIKKTLTVYPIRFLLHGQRSAYLIKEKIDPSNYYSLIIYLDQDCPLQ